KEQTERHARRRFVPERQVRGIEPHFADGRSHGGSQGCDLEEEAQNRRHQLPRVEGGKTKAEGYRNPPPEHGRKARIGGITVPRSLPVARIVGVHGCPCPASRVNDASRIAIILLCLCLLLSSPPRPLAPHV